MLKTIVLPRQARDKHEKLRTTALFSVGTRWVAGFERKYLGANNALFLNFSYVCPEPVLAKCSFLYTNCSKRAFFAGVFQDEEAAAKAHDAAARDAYGEAAHHYVRKHAAPLCLNFPTKAEVTRAVRQVTTVTKRSLLRQFYT